MLALRRPEGSEDSDPNLFALLSLKLLLLAFFILLTALATFERDKVELVVDSVNQAFDGRVRTELKNESVEPAALAELSEAAKLSERIRNLFSSTFPMAEVERDVLYGELRIELPTDTLFFADEARLRAGPAVLMNRLARLLGSERPADTDYELDVLVGVGRDALPALASTPDALASRRAGAFARDFARRGMPADKLSVGLLPGGEGKVRIVLSVRNAPSAARQDGAGPAAGGQAE
jgi:hypothetical protein